MSGFRCCGVSACAGLDWRSVLSPLLLPLVSLWLSGLWVGKIWCCGNLYGHHQRGRALSCSNMTGSQGARRHRSLVSNHWKAKDNREVFFFFFTLQEVLSWKNRNGGFEKMFSVSFMISSGRKIKQFNVPTGFSFLQFVCGVQQWPYPSWWYFYLLCYQCRSPKIFL